ncbi:PEP-CTERM sorting domain-containing protein [Altererythrobacter sp. ZODW24]|uniref:PEP-CTERM sorting domain-containing protein n=1 Tax=Altererythrobacter sp. ZODW24 TaxID=2185142 RepID=UPI000DF81B93|nr:PEP-CTERM sorting domain-containing protein [Altererythrobacter sp. ZODW24]
MSISATLSSALNRLPDLVAIQVPEPSNLALFAMGIVGVMLGRRVARKPKNADQANSQD